MTTTCRLLPLAASDGSHNMAADEVLLEAAEAGHASLRFYTWSKPTLSLGYFQPTARRTTHPLLAKLPWVRRATGGDALVHHHELTYALAVPAGKPWHSGDPWPQRMHRLIGMALVQFGVDCTQACAVPAEAFSGVLCFQHVTPCDLLLNGHKIAGSAQRRRRGALLQHGGILLARSKFAPALPGILELSKLSVPVTALSVLLGEAMQVETGWKLRPAPWTAAEQERTNALAAGKYSHQDWNEKR